ncbi:hypothetical protein F4803DRAFT_551541 [Xylaria telfairii]|nr:hypothetical protein F4803DRAFT_551541 [Xylaria telfairii]
MPIQNHATSPTATVSFPQFSRLPTEIRLHVWEALALPKSIYHAVKVTIKSLQIVDVVLCDSVGSTKRNETRHLMQVNREARYVVLSTRQFETWINGPPDRPARPRPSTSFSFVNWELDLFSIVVQGDVTSPGYIMTFEPFNKIKNLAFTTTYNTDQYRQPEPYTRFISVSPFECRWPWGSLKRIVVIIQRRTIPRHKRIYTRGYFEWVLSIDCETGWPFWDYRPLRVNEYGLATVTHEGPPAGDYEMCKAALLERGRESLRLHTEEMISFLQWLDRIVTEQRKEATAMAPGVKLEVMFDYQGIRDGYFEGLDIEEWPPPMWPSRVIMH